MVKKIVILGMILCMVLGMFGCGAKPAKERTEREANVTEIKEEGSKNNIPQLTLEEAF